MVDDIRSVVGARIRKERREQMMTVEELSFSAGVSRKHIWQCESGQANMTVEMLQKFADGLGVMIVDLLPDSVSEVVANN